MARLLFLVKPLFWISCSELKATAAFSFTPREIEFNEKRCLKPNLNNSVRSHVLNSLWYSSNKNWPSPSETIPFFRAKAIDFRQVRLQFSFLFTVASIEINGGPEPETSY